MKCKNCGEKLGKKDLRCPFCRAANTGSRFGRANTLMLILAVLQTALLTFLIVCLVKGSFVDYYLKDRNYKKAAELIDRFDFLGDSENIRTMSSEAVSSVKQDYIDGRLGYDDAVDDLSYFMEINSGGCKDMASSAADDILEIEETRGNLKLGNQALDNGDFESAIVYYDLISEADTKYYPLKDELKDGVYRALETHLDDIAEKNSYKDALEQISQMKSDAVTEDFTRRLSSAEDNYLYKWILQCQSEGNFFGKEGVMELSILYDQQTGNTDQVGDVYMNYVNYLNQFTVDGHYRVAIDKMNADFPGIEKYSDKLDVKLFSSMRLYYAEGLLKKSEFAGKYTGSDGIIAISRELNSYGVNPELDIDSIIDEYTERERQEFIAWINAERADRGLSSMKDNADLKKAATSMISDTGESIYNDVSFENNMNKYKIEYSYASVVTIMKSTDAEAFEYDIERNGADYSIMNEPGLNKIGVGMKYDKETETFSWFVIGIK